LAISSIKRISRTRTWFVFGLKVRALSADGGGADRAWLPTGGTGGYATGTVAERRIRRRHGPLVTSER